MTKWRKNKIKLTHARKILKQKNKNKRNDWKFKFEKPNRNFSEI